MRSHGERRAWVAYARVSTAEQAEKDLSLPAQCKAVAEFAARHDASIAQEYIEAGASGTDANRPVFNRCSVKRSSPPVPSVRSSSITRLASRAMQPTRAS